MKKARTGQGLLGPWRRTLQWGLSLLLLGIPFVRMGGESLLRLDLPTLVLHVAGHALPIEELYLFLFFAVALVLLFLLVTLAFGRAWCGWACPQTTLSDLTEGVQRRLGLVSPGRKATRPIGKIALFHLFCLVLALLVGANLVWYFLSPYEFFLRLMAGRLGAAAAWTLAVTALVVYLDLVFVRRLLCREFCPYGRFQSALVDPGTLTLRFHPAEAQRCIRCGACVRACPMGIDIRRGDQIECINCGRCLDACRAVMAQRGQPGIIRYTFGVQDDGLKALRNPRLLLVAAAWLAVAAVLGATLLLRADITLKLGRPDEFPARALSDEQTVNDFRAVISNRGRNPLEIRLQALSDDDQELKVLGAAQHLSLEGRERRRLEFAVVAPSALVPTTARVRILDSQGQILVEDRVHLIAPMTQRTFP